MGSNRFICIICVRTNNINYFLREIYILQRFRVFSSGNRANTYRLYIQCVAMILESATFKKLFRDNNIDRPTRLEYFSISYRSSHCQRSFLKKFSKKSNVYLMRERNRKRISHNRKIREIRLKKLIASSFAFNSRVRNAGINIIL